MLSCLTELELGFVGRRISFEHRPYLMRSTEAQADYDALELDIHKHGIRDPLITHEGHVLVGMRRYEIARKIGVTRMMCIEIDEDVSEWWREGHAKLAALKKRYYK